MYPISEEEEITSIITSCITSYGRNGVPLDMIENEFQSLCGFSIPYKKFGCDSVKSFLMTLPNIYILMDEYDNEVVIEKSPKSVHLRNLISKQRLVKRKWEHVISDTLSDYNYDRKKRRTSFIKTLPKGSFIHSSYNKKIFSDARRFEEYLKLEEMFPVIYRHQALGDDFFVDLADKKLGCYIFPSETRQCGLCKVGMTISELTEKVTEAQRLAPRVVVLVGMNDLIQGSNANKIILDLRKLIAELKQRKTRVTLLTLIPSPKIKMTEQVANRMEIVNKAIIEYGSDPELMCNVIDMNRIFMREKDEFRRDFNRLEKIAKNDNYKVFSDYGRKIFLNALKSCLSEQIECGH